MATKQPNAVEKPNGGANLPAKRPAEVVVEDIKRGSMSFDDLQRLGGLLAQSNMFPGITDVSKACVKVLAGAEMGFGPIASLTNIHVIQNKIQIGANLLAIKVRQAGYRYKVTWLPDHKNPDACAIEFFENGESIGVSEFSMDDAKAASLAGKDNWRNYSRNMLFARAISNGVKWYCPEVVGSTVYVEEELRALPNPAEVATINPSQLIASTDPNRGHDATQPEPQDKPDYPQLINDMYPRFAGLHPNDSEAEAAYKTLKAKHAVKSNTTDAVKLKAFYKDMAGVVYDLEKKRREAERVEDGPQPAAEVVEGSTDLLQR